MTRKLKIKRGLDIPLEGRAEGNAISVNPQYVGLVPDDFEGHSWKCPVKEGDAVEAGTPLLHDKATGLIKIVSPAAGTVREVRRGERRKILAVVVEVADSAASEAKFDLALNADAIRSTLLQSGLWAMMRQRPFDIVPDPESTPRDIFVTAFDSAPLAAALFSREDMELIEKGLEILGIIGGRKPYVATPANSPYEFRNGENIIVDGPHPAGNVGVHIANVAPVNKGETIWTLDIVTVRRIGTLYSTGRLDWSARVALTGPEMPNPGFVETLIGCDMRQLLPASIAENPEVRIISGNVLTGKRVNPADGFLRYPYRQITAIAEGDHADEFMGWASMSPSKFSTKRTFPAFLKGLKGKFPFDARIKGGRRAMIMSGEFDKVFPFDIYPEYLLRAMHSGDIDRMEKLGVYEVAPEDFALPEFVDTSKHELQQLVRDSLDMLRDEG